MYCIGVKAAPNMGGVSLDGRETSTGGGRVEELIGWGLLVVQDIFSLLNCTSRINRL